MASLVYQICGSCGGVGSYVLAGETIPCTFCNGDKIVLLGAVAGEGEDMEAVRKAIFAEKS